MPIFELTPQMMREIMIDHYTNPRHRGVPTSNDYQKVHTDSVNCIDDFDVYLKSAEGKVIDAKWEGQACTISSSSTDILCDLVIGKQVKDGLYIIEQYLKMIHEETYDESVLEELLAFKNTSKQAARIHCATMGFEAIKELLQGEKNG